MSRWFVLLLSACAPQVLPVEQAPPPFDLSGPAALVRGSTARFTVDVPAGVPDGTRVTLGAAASAGAGPCPGFLFGECIDLAPPIILVGREALSGGTVSFDVAIPDVRLPSVSLQAAFSSGGQGWVSDTLTAPLVDAVCGDGFLQTGEECDNSVVSDLPGGCAADCTINPCQGPEVLDLDIPDGASGLLADTWQSFVVQEGGYLSAIELGLNELVTSTFCVGVTLRNGAGRTGSVVFDDLEYCGTHSGWTRIEQPDPVVLEAGRTYTIELETLSGNISLTGISGDFYEEGSWLGTDDTDMSVRTWMRPFEACRYHCGNGVLDGFETCDDGNEIEGDGCGPTCQIESCGDGVVQPAEICDDGSLNGSYDACDATCAAMGPTCGDAINDPEEECDRGWRNRADEGNGGCGVDCLRNTCFTTPGIDVNQSLENTNFGSFDAWQSFTVTTRGQLTDVEIASEAFDYDGCRRWRIHEGVGLNGPILWEDLICEVIPTTTSPHWSGAHLERSLTVEVGDQLTLTVVSASGDYWTWSGHSSNVYGGGMFSASGDAMIRTHVGPAVTCP